MLKINDDKHTDDDDAFCLNFISSYHLIPWLFFHKSFTFLFFFVDLLSNEQIKWKILSIILCTYIYEVNVLFYIFIIIIIRMQFSNIIIYIHTSTYIYVYLCLYIYVLFVLYRKSFAVWWHKMWKLCWTKIHFTLFQKRKLLFKNSKCMTEFIIHHIHKIFIWVFVFLY